MNFERELKMKKLKVTPQRIAILKEIQSNGHISIEDIYEKIKQNYPSTSLATIYKNIATLCESNILCEVKAPGYKQKYELNQTQHIHVMCEQCGKLEDLYIDFSALQHDCGQVSGYRLYGLSAIFMGICPSCDKKTKEMDNQEDIYIAKEYDHRQQYN